MDVFLHRVLRALGRVCGWLGFATVVLELFALVMLYFQAFVHAPVIKSVLLPDPQATSTQAHVSQQATVPASMGWVVPLAAAVAIVALGYGIFRLVTKDVPEVKEKAEEAVQKVALHAIKKIEKHKNITKKRERALTVRVVFWLKIVLAVMPLVVVLTLHNITASLPATAATLLMSGLALSAVIWFTLERVLASVIKNIKTVSM